MHRIMQYVSVNALPNVGRVHSANTRAYWLTYCNKYILKPMYVHRTYCHNTERE